MSLSSCSSSAGAYIDMGETPLSAVGRRDTPSASNASLETKNGAKGQKQRTSRARTETDLLKDFTELLADGASAAKALELEHTESMSATSQ
jgi:hypothetical protein